MVDTSVVVAGLRSQLGASNRILTFVAEGRLVPLVTTVLFLEYEDVLNRPEQRLATGMSMSDVWGFWLPWQVQPKRSMFTLCGDRN